MTNKYCSKILFLTTAMTGGGAERVVVDLLNNLDRSKYKPSLGLFRKEGPYLHDIQKDIPIVELSGCSTNYKSILSSRQIIPKLINRLKPDLIVSHLVGANTSILRSTLGFKNIPPIIVCEHNNLSLNMAKRSDSIKKKIKIQEIKLLYKKAKKIITVSDGIKQDLIANHGMAFDHIKVIHNPVDIGKIENIINANKCISHEKERKVKKIVAVGRLIKQKGFSDLIDAFAMLLKSIPAKLTILGEGDLRPVLEKHIQELGLKDHIRLPGFVDDPWTTIHESDLFVLSSHWEGFGNVIVEAIACGTPVVATDCNYGPREIIKSGQNGILVPVGDIPAIKQAMIKILKDDQLSQILVSNAKKISYKFEAKHVTRIYEQLFDEIIDQNN